MSQGLQELEAKVEGISLQALSENESFVTTFFQASQAAMRTHQAEKRQALHNAVLNATLPNAPDDDRQQMFLNFVDTLTPWHLRLLRFLSDPVAWDEDGASRWANSLTLSLHSMIEDAFPELKEHQDYRDQLARDLYGRGLSKVERLHPMTTARGALSAHTTAFGDAFLRFIASPDLDSSAHRGQLLQ